MYRSQFRPPLLKKAPGALNGAESIAKEKARVDEPPMKKLKVSDEPIHRAATVSSASAPESPPGDATPTNDVGGTYGVLWRKKTTKKHKTWDGDGVLCIRKGQATLSDTKGKVLGKSMYNATGVQSGDVISVAGRDVEIDSVMESTSASSPAEPVQPQARAQVSKLAADPTTKFKMPLKESPVSQSRDYEKQPRYDAANKDAILMPKMKGPPPASKHYVDVVVDPTLAAHLRPHQKAGVIFLYECVMQLRGFDGQGAILADEMGLGKTLQTICLLWTLMKQNPVYEDLPVVKSAMIACPVTLINV